MKKKIFTASFFTFFSLILIAQDVKYEAIKNDPDNINNLWVNADVAQMDAGFSNFYGLSFNAGVWGLGVINDKIGFDYTLRYGWLSMPSLVGDKDVRKHSQIELGGFFQFLNKYKDVERGIPLKDTYVQDKYNSTQLNTATLSIKVPTKRRTIFAARGGLIIDRGGYSPDDISLLPREAERLNYSRSGVYVGICETRVYNIFIKTENYGNAKTSSYARFYFDAMILPMVKFTAPVTGTDYSSSVAHSNIGWRVGMDYMQPSTKKESHAIVAQIQMGMRPIDGIFMTGGISIPIYRNKVSFGKTEAPAEKK